MKNPYICTTGDFKGVTFYPIIFLRGFAMKDSDIEEAVNEPFSGFERGSTKYRQGPEGQIKPYYFESPILRLIRDYYYEDTYSDGMEIDTIEKLSLLQHPERALWVYRYYEQASEVFGDNKRDSIHNLALGLDDMIERLRKLYTAHGADHGKHFKVHLVAHSMGGLVVRSYLQSAFPERFKKRTGKAAKPGDTPVDKVFTYGTPHNGIEIKGLGNRINVGLFDISNFYREEMLGYLGKPPAANDLGGKFDPKRLFCLIGTNARDYDVAVSRAAVGPLSDGLVRIDNAWTADSPRAHIHRAHGGPLGMVNSEEGYQNLQRFLFGNTRVDGHLELQSLGLPDHVLNELSKGKEVQANYYFETIVSTRGSFGWNLTRRLAGENSAVRRGFADLFRNDGQPKPQPVYLFSSFLDTRQITGNQKYMAFAVDIKLVADQFEIDRKWWFDASFDGVTYYSSKLYIQLLRPEDGKSWKLKWHLGGSESPERIVEGVLKPDGTMEFRIPLSAPSPGFAADFVLTASRWE